MSTTYVGIENANEFFTAHYVEALLSADTRPVLAAWREQATDDKVTPPRALGRLHRSFFAYLDALGRITSDERRVAEHTDQAAALLEALGYAPALSAVRLPSGHVPRLATVKRANGAPLLWAISCVAAASDDRPTLSGRILPAQLVAVPDPAYGDEDRVCPELPLEQLASEAFGLEEPPRFLLLLGTDDVILLERGKWAESRWLRFDLAEILGRREAQTLELTAVLLHRDELAPVEGSSRIDTLDESSHRHAFGVSEDLKYALQASIERLGQSVIDQLSERRRKAELARPAFAGELAEQCLRYMYRLLFVFYIEARPELGYAPMGEDAYRLGYSLERLRDLEQVDLHSETARTGTYIHESIELLFRMIHEGRTAERQRTFDFEDRQADVRLELDGGGGTSTHLTFDLPALKSHLFDPERTPLLARVKFPNEVLRDILEKMSLSREGGRGRRGRISYATLGINQLGAVYEALLSFRGFIAPQTLFEVKPAKQAGQDVLGIAYFVPEAELDRYTNDERVYEPDGTLKRYPAGTFIYRLAGRDRQTSASYYTPEVLTRAVVRYALEELLTDDMPADEILELTVCEPAMGSAAFLNEAVDQLAEAYLRRKQTETGNRIPHDRVAYEKQRVKMFIADRNVFGVDKNPLAVELAEVSLWLGSIHEGGFVPWFGGQTVCGDSLVGARRQVFGPELTVADKAPWLDAVPERVLPGEARPDEAIYHFLLGDRKMSVYGHGTEGRPIRELAGRELDAIDRWREQFCAPLEDDERTALVGLSAAVDRLWARHERMLRDIRDRTTDPLSVWGHGIDRKKPTSLRFKDQIWSEQILSEGVRLASPYRRLKLAMDYWCALWFWPIEQADQMPSRDEFLLELSLLLDTDVLTGEGDGDRPAFAETMPEVEARELARDLGFVDLERLAARYERLRIVRDVASRRRFLHWELEFADLFAERGGFDLMLGNPPWIRVEWKEQDVLGDVDPSFAVKTLSARQTTERRLDALESEAVRSRYYAGHADAAGMQSFLSARQSYPALIGLQTNLYKCFLPVVWGWTSAVGVAGLLHPEKVYDEPAGGRLRALLYRRLRRHYQFRNELPLFEGTNDHGRLIFSINIYGPEKAIGFENIVHLFHPKTIEACHAHLGHGLVPGIKTDDDRPTWSLEGHRDRIVPVDRKALELFARLYSEAGTAAEEARLPALHSAQMLPVLRRMAAARRLGDLEDYFPTCMWDESRAQRDGTIRRETSFPAAPGELVLSGPHFYVGNPLYKSPRSACTQSSHYDVLDLTCLPQRYLPRSNFAISCSPEDLSDCTPRVPWGGSVSDCHRLLVNRGLNPAMERTLQPAVTPPGPGHVHGVYSYAFAQSRDLLTVVSTWMALPIDFFIKSTGAGDFFPNLAKRLPILDDPRVEVRARTLLLNGLTTHFADFWGEAFDPAFAADRWTKADPRLDDAHFARLTPDWTRDTPLRTDYARRQALVEIDVLVSMALGLTLDQLQTIYRAQFFVLRQNEADTWYDREGRIVFTCSKGLPGVGLPRTSRRNDPTPAWNDVKAMTSGTVERTIVDDTLPGGPRERTITFAAPFDRCDREADYETAWAHFTKRFGEDGP